MIRPILVLLLVLAQGSCSSPAPIITDTIDCLKAEATTVAGGTDLVQLVNEIYSDIQSAGFLGAIESLIAKYGLDVVVCVVDSYPAAESSGSGVQVSAGYAKKQMLLQKFAPSKKFNHGSPKN